MKKYEELHATIKSMDGHEVRYFKLFAARHIIGKSNTYLKLFDALRKQEKSNDTELRQVFKKDAFTRNLPSAKLYLLRLINKSLYHFHDKEDVLSVVLRHIKLAELFFIKENYDLTESNLKKAKRLAEKEEQFTFSLLISELQIKLSIFSANQNKVATLISDEMAYEKSIFEKYLNLREYQHALAKFKALEKTIFIPVNTSEKKQYDAILDADIFSYVSMAQSNKARNIFYELKNSYQDKTKDKLQKQEITNELLDFFIEYPQLFRKNASAFINATDEYLNDCLTTKDFFKFSIGLSKFKKLSAPSDILNAQIISRGALHEINYTFLSNNFVKAKEIITHTEKQLSKFEDSIKNDLLCHLYYHLSFRYYQSKEYKQALKWNIEIANSESKKIKEETLRKANLLNLILHFKLLNYDFLENRITSEKRRFKNQIAKYKPELLVMDTIQKLILKNKAEVIKKTVADFEREMKNLSGKHQFEFLFSDGFLNKPF